MFKSTLNHILLRTASRHLTLLAMFCLGVSVLFSYNNPKISTDWIALPLIVLGINLLAVILTSLNFRRQYGLLFFHIGLLAIIILAAQGLMSSLQARLEITEGQVFDPANIMIIQQGPWHRLSLPKGLFTQGPIQVDYAPGLRRRSTRSEILLADVNGKSNITHVGDGRTFSSAGYRFITTFNKGYAILFSWHDGAGDTIHGSVHLPSFPEFEWKQENEWITPGGDKLSLILKRAHPVDREISWVLNSKNQNDLSLMIKIQNHSIELKKGQTLKLHTGSIRFDDVRMWMGYRIDYNPMLTWLLMAALISITALGFHFRQKYFRHSVKFHPVSRDVTGNSVHA